MATADLLTPPPIPRKDPTPRRWSADEFHRVIDLGLFPGRSIILAEGQLLESFSLQTEPRPVMFTQEEYHALNETGFFQYQRVQLIGGEIVLESPMKPPHALCIRLATKALEKVFNEGFDIRVQLPLDLNQVSEPHPDLAIVAGSPRDYYEQHPRFAKLVIEVSETTLEEDTHTKASLYAAASIADYWVIDVTGRVLVFREPHPEAGQPFGYAYRRVTAHSRGEVITPLELPEARIKVDDLLY